MKKRVLLIAGNYYPELTGIGRYNAEMIDWFADNGFHCTVVTTYPYYPQWKIQAAYQKKRRWFTKETKSSPKKNSIIVYRCPHHIPAGLSGRQRIFFDFSFFLSAAVKLITLTGKKYDYVINVTPPLALGMIAAVYKKVSGAKFLYHIQDLQVDAARDLNMITSKRLINALLKIEVNILKKADSISTISEEMQHKVMHKINKPVLLFPNWSDTKSFFPLADKAALKNDYGFKHDVPVVLYSGAIGKKQGLENVLWAAQSLQLDNLTVQFIICGSGPNKLVLEEKAAELNLNNISFMDLQPNEKLNIFLNMADVHLVIQKAAAADLVMPSKLTNILSIGGLAVVTANKNSGLYKLIEQHKMGLLCAAEDKASLIEAIRFAITFNHAEICRNARKYAEQYLSIDKIMHRYVNEVMN